MTTINNHIINNNLSFHIEFILSLYRVELFTLNKSYMFDLYTAHRKVPAHTHN